MNNFERAAHDIRPRKARPSYEHKVETYTGGQEKDLFFSFIIAVFIGSVTLVVLERTGLTQMFINLFG